MAIRYTYSFLFIVLYYICIAQARSFRKGETVPVFYNKIFSRQQRLPFSYSSLPFICPPYTQASWKERTTERTWIGVDQDITGDHPVKSDYKITALENIDCITVCTQPWSVSDAMNAKELIENDYQVEWWLDDIPGATASYTNEISTLVYRVGYPIGQMLGGDVFFNNHVTFNILYSMHGDDPLEVDIVGFEIYPQSIKTGDCQRETIDHEMQQVTERRTSVTFTYSVKWKQVEASSQSSPWDRFLIPTNTDTYLVASINMAIMTLLLSFVVGTIMVKTLKNDTSVSRDQMHDDYEDVIGWRLVHRDVFRRPAYSGLFARLIGTGIQLLVMALIIIGFVYGGQIHLAKPGSLVSCFITLYIPSSFIAGYWSSRIFKIFHGKPWIFNSVLTSLMLPGFIAFGLFIQTLFAWSAHSSIAISFRGWLSLTLLWGLLVVPLTIVGGYFGDRCQGIEHPTRTTQMPRIIPNKRWYQQYNISILLGGIIPFAVIFIDLNELLKSSWHGELYLSISHLTLACVVMAVTVSQVTVVLIFFQLCNEDYHWWWMSFVIGASSSMYMFLYGLIFYIVNTSIVQFWGGMIYVIQLILGCVLTGLTTGSLGFICTYWMIRRIYSSVKMD